MYIITGASGQLGRLIVAELLKHVPPTEVGVSVRDPQKVQDLAAQGVTVHQADYDHVEALVTAFSGAEKVVFVSGNTAVEARNIQHQNVIRAAEQAGVQQVIYTGFLDTDPASPFTFTPSHTATEAVLRASTLDWVVVRPSAYMDGLPDEARRALEHGALVSAAPEGRVSYITRADIARAIVAILISGGHSQKVYTLTGPEAVSPSDIAALLTAISGKPVTVQPISYDAYAAGLESFGLPPFLVAAVRGLQQAMNENLLAPVSDDIERLTGQPPESVESYLTRHLAA